MLLYNFQENEKIKDVILEPRIQTLLRSGKPPPIRQILDSFHVDIRWPQQVGTGSKQECNEKSSANEYVVQISGVRDQVDAAAEKLNKLVKQIKEENYEQEVKFALRLSVIYICVFISFCLYDFYRYVSSRIVSNIFWV